MEYSHDQHIGIYKNAISNEWCNKVIEYYENNSDKASPRSFKWKGGDEVRDTSCSLNNEELRKNFLDNFEEVFNFYRYKYPLVDYAGLLQLNDMKIQKTLPTEGYHPYHIEHGNAPPSIWRVGVYTVYLNDVEEGGETEFLYQLKRIKPQKGTLCIFPASYTHVHRGNTPISGEKYIMTGWLSMFPLLNKEEIET